jgi:hypothetical protein
MEAREILVAIGVDCDPDRDVYPSRLAWKGVEALHQLLDIPDTRWTLNVRADTQIRDHCGSAAFCMDRYAPLWDKLRSASSEIAWHLHYFGRDGRQDTSEANIVENVRIGSAALGNPDIVHMGWTFQSDFSIRQLAAAGVRVDYSPVPRLRSSGRGVDAYDWSGFSYRPRTWHGVRMIPAYSFRHGLLARRFRTERVMLTMTTEPALYRLLLRDFFRTGSDFFVSYFHADELVSALGDWRARLYSSKNLVTNIRRMREMADRAGYQLRFVTVRELADYLFDGDRPRHA